MRREEEDKEMSQTRDNTGKRRNKTGGEKRGVNGEKRGRERRE